METQVENNKEIDADARSLGDDFPRAFLRSFYVVY